MVDVELFEQIINHIEAEPRRLHMDGWGYIVPEDERDGITNPPCNTVGCIAGWSLMLTGSVEIEGGYIVFPSDVFEKASEILGIPQHRAQTLFYVHHWPDNFRIEYDVAEMEGDAKKMAEITIERIRDFMEKEKIFQGDRI